MFKKKPIYIVGIIIFTLILIADVVIFFAVPKEEKPGNIPSFENGSFNAEDFEGEMPDFDGEMPDFGGEMPDFGGEMPDFGGEIPDFGGEAPDFEGAVPEGFDASMIPPNGNNSNGFLQTIRNMFLVILIISILGDTICIVMLIVISRKNNKSGTNINQNEDDDDISPHRSHTNAFLSIIAVILVGAVTISNIPSGNNGSERETENSILQQEAEINDIVGTFSGSGTLNSSDADVINIPASINVTSYTVQNGDYVEEGDEIAKVDKNSVLSTIYKVQNLVNEMDAEIAETKELTFDDEIKSQAAGRVKAVYAKEGDSVSETMYENEALILISLGGSMEVQIESTASVDIGQSVMVTLSDEKTIEGKVQQTRNGKITITTSDNGPTHGDIVTVATEDGTNLGSGTLEVSSPLKITNFAGKVKTVHVKVNDEVNIGDVLLTLDDSKDHARYNQLLQERDELMELEDELNQIYKNGTINAKQSGIVSQLDEEIAYTELSDTSTEENVADNLSASYSNSFEIVQLSNMTVSDAKIAYLVNESTSPDDETEPSVPETVSVTYAGIVTKISYGTMQIKISETDAGNMNITELEAMDKSLFTVEKVYYPDLNIPVYVYQNGESIPSSVDVIEVNDKVLIQVENDIITQIDYISIEEDLTNQDTIPSETLSSDTVPSNNIPPENDNNNENIEMPSFNDNFNYQNPIITDNSENMQIPSANGDFGYQSQTTEEEEEATYVVEKISLYAVTPSETMTISVSVDELDILSLSVSQEVIITLDALPGQSLTGTVKRISPIGTSENGDRTKYTVTIEVPRTEEMLDGMNASVIIEINRLKDVLTVPASAICEDGTRTYVYTGKEDETGELTNPIDVETGASDGTNVEIISGISEGDTIYYSYADSIVYRTK